MAGLSGYRSYMIRMPVDGATATVNVTRHICPASSPLGETKQGLYCMSAASTGNVYSTVPVLQDCPGAHRHVVTMLDRITNSYLEVGLHSCVCHLLLQRSDPSSEQHARPLPTPCTLPVGISAYVHSSSQVCGLYDRQSQDIGPGGKIPLRPSPPTRKGVVVRCEWLHLSC